MPSIGTVAQAAIKTVASPVTSVVKAFRRWRVRRSEKRAQSANKIQAPATNPTNERRILSRFFSRLKNIKLTLNKKGKNTGSIKTPDPFDDTRFLVSHRDYGDIDPAIDHSQPIAQKWHGPSIVSEEVDTSKDGLSENKPENEEELGGEAQLGTDINEVLKARKDQEFEERLAKGALAAGAATGVAIGAASAAQPGHSKAMFDHILQKDTPLDRMVILSEHNALAMPGKGSIPFVATNQTLSIEETLEKTPVRGFDIDLHQHNGEVVINHGGYYDPLVSDDNIPRLGDALNPINSWLDKPGNSDEVVFINFENKQHLDWNEVRSIFGSKAISSHELSNLTHKLGHTPTINELTADGPKVLIMQGSHYHGAGVGSVDYGWGCSVRSIWEDRTLLGAAGPDTHPEIAPRITSDDIDNLLHKGQGRFVSLDQISPNDPRFFKPEDRPGLALHPDNSILGTLYYSNEDFQSALLGMSAAASTATGALGIAAGIYQGVGNERQIRGQSKRVPEYLKRVELLAILQERKNKKKPLDATITPEEIKALYLKQQKREITKNTLMPGISSTVSVSGSLLSLGMLFPPAFPALAIASASAGGAGVVSTLAATGGNRVRLGKAINKVFSESDIQKQLESAASQLESERQKLMAGSSVSDGKTRGQMLQRALSQRSERNRLTKASQLMLGGTLVARVSGMSKYGIPAIGTAAMGAGAAITGVLVALSAAMNFKDRRQKLQNLPGTMAEVLQPVIDNKRFWLFGSTPFERYLKKHWGQFQKEHAVFHGLTLKQALKQYKKPDLNPVSDLGKAFHACRTRCIHGHWEKELTHFLKKRKPPEDFQKIRENPVLLKKWLKEFAIKRVGDFAHNDTFRSGRNNTLRLSLISAFAAVFFFPMLGVAAGTLLTGLGVAKAVAVRERRLFEKKLRRAMDTPADNPESQMTTKLLDGLLSTWTNMLKKPAAAA